MAGLVPQGTLGTGLSIKPAPEVCKAVIFFHVLCYLLSSGQSGWSLEMHFVFPAHFPPAAACSGCGQHFPQCPWSHPCDTVVPSQPPQSCVHRALGWLLWALLGFCLQEQPVG